ncbi:MAG: M20/M25/M40 family metallo-hydrolase [Sphingopyxis sp.]|nr:M20/M25/M40 family metallo-hydrolase [Sphingopyxis sp.]
MLQQTLDWAAINSGSHNLDGLGAMAASLADAFSVLPGHIRLVDPAPVEIVRSNGTVDTLTHGQHVTLTVRPDAPLRMLFTGHMDTVFPVDHPFQHTRWLDDGQTINGPGVADMKGGIAVMLAALSAVEASGAGDGFGYDIILNSDEEVGSLSSAALIAALARDKAAAFTYEPSALPDGTLAGARPGSGNFAITIRGKSAHAGRNPEDGRNAIVAAADLAVRLKSAVRPGIAINPAKIDGGSGNKCHGHFARPPKPIDARSERLFEIVNRAGSDLGLSIGRKDSGGVCDGNNIAACGVPVVDTMGVRGGSIHSDAEFMIVDSLSERARLSALAILRIISAGGV